MKSRKDIMKSIRLHKIKDKELIEFFDEKGLKYGIKFLYDFYISNKDISNKIIKGIKEEINFIASKPISNMNVVEQKGDSTSFNTDDAGFNLDNF